MAGGIDWFRWHHGTVTDPKLGVVAKKSGSRVSDVIALWAFLLEAASASADRGQFGELDHESIDHLLGFDEGQSLRILQAMSDRGLVDEETISSWDKRQPKRERDTDSSAERVRAHRQRQKEQSEASDNQVTPCNATQHQSNARGEERREEKEQNQPPAAESASTDLQQPSADEPSQTSYAFEGESFRINQRDFKQHSEIYPKLDLLKQYRQLDIELRDTPKKQRWGALNAKLDYRNKNRPDHQQDADPIDWNGSFIDDATLEAAERIRQRVGR